VTAAANRDQRFTVDARDYSQLRHTFDKILKVFETGDLVD
jgi:hypothetical protein